MAVLALNEVALLHQVIQVCLLEEEEDRHIRMTALQHVLPPASPPQKHNKASFILPAMKNNCKGRRLVLSNLQVRGSEPAPYSRFIHAGMLPGKLNFLSVHIILWE